MSTSITTYERSTLMNREKYMGLDVHQATIAIAVMDWFSTPPNLEILGMAHHQTTRRIPDASE